jgi:hypothetical protein
MRMLEIECDHVSLGFAFGPYIEEFRIGIGANCGDQKDRFRPSFFMLSVPPGPDTRDPLGSTRPRHVLPHCCKERPSARIRRHGRAMSYCRCPIFDAPLADCIRRSCLKDWSSFLRVDLLLRDLPVGTRGPHRASVLSVERLDDHLGDRVGVLVEHEVTAVEILQVGRRHNLLHDFRTRISPVRSRSPAPSFQSALTPQTVPRPLLVPLWCRLKIARARRQVPPNHVLIKSYAEARPVGHFDPSMIDDRCLNPLFDQR